MGSPRMRWLLVALMCALVVGAPRPTLAQDADDDILSKTPPALPTLVTVALEVEHVSAIDERDGHVEINGTLAYLWADGAVTPSCDDIGEEDRIYQGESATEKLKTIWWPEFGINGVLGPRESISVGLTISCADGLPIPLMIYEERFQAQVAQDFATLNDFPFDEHEIAFTIMPSVQGNDLVELVTIEELLGDLYEIDPSDLVDETPAVAFQWDGSEWTFERDDFTTAVLINPNDIMDNGDIVEDEDSDFAGLPDPTGPNGEQWYSDPDDATSYYGDRNTYLPSATFRLTMTRAPGFYILNIILPLVLIVSISWVVFWGNRGMSLAERLGISITCLLTVVAFDFLTGDSLPRLPYTTRLDAFYNVSYLFVGFTVLESVISARPKRGETVDVNDGDEPARAQIDAATTKPKHPPATTIDRVCRWLVPLSYTAAVALALLGLFSPGVSGT